MLLSTCQLIGEAKPNQNIAPVRSSPGREQQWSSSPGYSSYSARSATATHYQSQTVTTTATLPATILPPHAAVLRRRGAAPGRGTRGLAGVHRRDGGQLLRHSKMLPLLLFVRRPTPLGVITRLYEGEERGERRGGNANESGL